MKEQLLSTLETSRAYTLAVAEAMPENLYDTKPTEAVWNFRELLHHIAYGILWWEETSVRRNEADWNPPVTKNNKEQVMEYLSQAYDSLRETISDLKMSEEVITGFYATIDHITHHRGQAVLHLRCNGIEPPAYIF